MKLYTKESLTQELKTISEKGWVPNARAGHNHGSKFRMKQNCLPSLYEKATVIFG
jgi:hypothetical protein